MIYGNTKLKRLSIFNSLSQFLFPFLGIGNECIKIFKVTVTKKKDI
jgi:hypothetical protein